MRYCVLIVLAMLLLSGCTDVINKWELDQAETICKERGGIDYYRTSSLISYGSVRCSDGTYVDIKTPTT